VSPEHPAAQDHIDMLIRGWRGHANLSRRRFMEVERSEALELLDEIERLRREIDLIRPHVEGLGYVG